MKKYKEKMQTGVKKVANVGVVYSCIFNYGKNVAKTTFSWRSRNDGGTEKIK